MSSVKKVKIGNIRIGGGEKIAVQSMATTKLENVSESVAQSLRLQNAGCDIIRFSVLDEKDVKAIASVKKEISMPLVADIHFDYRLALSCIDGGADKIRINPGNIGGEDKVKEVAAALREKGIPVRVGSNTGSIEKEFLEKYGRSYLSLAESALKRVASLEKYGVENIVVSVKASDVLTTIRANEYIAGKCGYPLHIGVTEAGTKYNGDIKNSLALGALLSRGVGDTVRVSLSADPVREVIAAKTILADLKLIEGGAEVIACPTCGRCLWNCMEFASLVEDYVKNVKKPLKIAVMGCVVNGPGEAKDADIGIAGSGESCVIFRKGVPVKTVKKEDAKQEFFGEIDKCLR